MNPRECPWRGLLPYDEGDAPRFFGRTDDVHRLADKLDREKLVILTGPSAAGKTSLLRAGLIPGLRQRRRDELAAGEVPSVGVTVVLRDWAVSNHAMDDILSATLLQALVKLDPSANWERSGADGRVDSDTFKKLLSAADPAAISFLERIRRIEAEKVDLILIFDQLEEILRIGKGRQRDRNVSEALELIAPLLQKHRQHRVLLSLREEYLSDLRDLEQTAGGVFGRTIWLLPLPKSALNAVVRGPAKVARVEVGDDFLPQLIDVLESVEDTPEPGTGDAHEAGDVVDDGEPVNMLNLQASLQVIWEARERALALGQATDSALSAADVLRGVELAQPPAEAGSAGREDKVAAKKRNAGFLVFALRNAVLAALGLSIDAPSLSHKDGSHRDLLAGIAARMAPFLSAGGIKVLTDEAGLLIKSLREEREALEISEEDAIAILGALKVGLLLKSQREEREALELGEEEAAGVLAASRAKPTTTTPKPTNPESRVKGKSKTLVSGIAREEGWTTRYAWLKLMEAGLEALGSLRAANILRRCGETDKGQPLWQLVHDGMGDPLATWANGWRLGFRDATARLAVCRGYGIRVFSDGDVPPLISNANWWGCWVGPGPDFRKAPAHDVVICDSDFRGTIFDRFSMGNVQFVNCDFNGTVFRNCDLSNVTFTDCKCYGQGIMLQGGTLAHVLFQAVNKRLTYQHTIVEKAELAGPLTFRGLVISHSSFLGLKHLSGGRLAFEDCSLSHSSWDTQGNATMIEQCTDAGPNSNAEA
jgi:hypothetical protein